MVESSSHLPHTPIRRAVRALLVLTAALVAGLAGLTSAAAARPRPCAGAHTPIVAAKRSQMRAAVVCLVNQQRTERRLPRLAGSARLNTSAQGWTNVMVRRHAFTHGASFSARISAAGFDWSTIGENIAAGFPTPASVVTAWMASPGHCANILNPAYREVGTGVSAGTAMRGASGTWTQDFGLLMGQHPASGNYGPARGCPYA
jgi:uncharacterized protein YkwD